MQRDEASQTPRKRKQAVSPELSEVLRMLKSLEQELAERTPAR